MSAGAARWQAAALRPNQGVPRLPVLCCPQRSVDAQITTKCACGWGGLRHGTDRGSSPVDVRLSWPKGVWYDHTRKTIPEITDQCLKKQTPCPLQNRTCGMCTYRTLQQWLRVHGGSYFNESPETCNHCHRCLNGVDAVKTLVGTIWKDGIGRSADDVTPLPWRRHDNIRTLGEKGSCL